MSILPFVPPLATGREKRGLDIRGFLAGLALSSAIGAVLYIFLMTGWVSKAALFTHVSP